MNIVDALIQNKMAISKAEARRTIAQGAVRILHKAGFGAYGAEFTDTIQSPDQEVEKGETVLVGVNKRFTVGD